eukprot:SAG31_NODE_7364_length_1709_cov_1.240373_1_plen_270_part_00
MSSVVPGAAPDGQFGVQPSGNNSLGGAIEDAGNEAVEREKHHQRVGGSRGRSSARLSVVDVADLRPSTSRADTTRDANKISRSTPPATGYRPSEQQLAKWNIDYSLGKQQQHGGGAQRPRTSPAILQPHTNCASTPRHRFATVTECEGLGATSLDLGTLTITHGATSGAPDVIPSTVSLPSRWASWLAQHAGEHHLQPSSDSTGNVGGESAVSGGPECSTSTVGSQLQASVSETNSLRSQPRGYVGDVNIGIDNFFPGVYNPLTNAVDK